MKKGSRFFDKGKFNMRMEFIAAFFMLGSVSLAGIDCGQLCREAAMAAKEKNYVAAEEKYTEAIAAAKDSQEKCRAISGRFNVLRNQKKWGELDSFMEKAIEDEMLKPQEIRCLLNMYASRYLWSNRIDYCLSLLQRAQQIPCPQDSNDYFRTYYYMAIIYERREQPETVIELMREILTVKRQHPANLYNANVMIGRAYEKLGKKGEALKHYQAALECGRKVKYKFDCSPAEKAVRRLEK